ncbi:MAG: DUF3108 domain-containing protein [Pseudomonadota bacterium]|nr:DUF3108 domain-containing protein [Pseudomonadota bacterium]
MKPFLKAAIVFYLVICESFAAAQHAAEFTANYRASANGLGASALRKLEILDGGLYQLSNSLEAMFAGQVIAKLSQTSEFYLNSHQLIPQSYDYLLSGISTRTTAISYDWDAGIAASSNNDESWSIKLVSGVMDELSHQFALRLRIQRGETENLEFELIDEDEIEVVRYRLLGKEILNTTLGRLNSTQFELLQTESSQRTTKIWLADDWQYLLIKIEQEDQSGLHIKLELENATVAGQKVAPLAN